MAQYDGDVEPGGHGQVKSVRCVGDHRVMDEDADVREVTVEPA